MKISLLCTALCLGLVVADKCPEPVNIGAKQAMVDNLLKFINKPHNPPAPVPSIDQAKLYGLGLLPKRDIFSIFDERQWPEAATLIRKFMNAASFEEMVKVAETLYPRVNEDMFLYCLSVAIIHRPDAQGVQVPRIQDVYPDKFFEHYLLTEIKNKIMAGKKNPVLNDTHDFHNHFDPYRRVDYFTEDMGMNAHHYHWHVLHPIFWPKDLKGLKKDRVGELFYWMHRQMVARFDSELLSNHLPRSTPFENWNDPIEIGYAPHLTIHRTGYRYMFRPDGLVLQDLPELTKNQMQTWKLRILRSIYRGNVTALDKSVHELRNEKGIDKLAHLIVSTTDSINRQYYGNLHSYAHVIASRIADADGKYHEDSGVMNDVTVAARDPIFYQWHKYIDILFQTYQDTLAPYSKYELSWPEVNIDEVHLEIDHDDIHKEIYTFWNTDDFVIGKGFDYTLDSEAVIHMKHLDHEAFTYVLDVTNNDKEEKHALFRVFLAPKYDERGRKLSLKEMRPMMIELDKFTYTLKPGHNTVRHNSNDSSVTMPRQMVYDRRWSSTVRDHCHCGWPDNLLLPKGSPDGMHFKLFVMASDWDSERVEDKDESCHCKNALSYCGTIYEQYPDKRPMGFPFDRPIQKKSLDEFNSNNMFSTDITVKFIGYKPSLVRSKH